MLFAPSAAFCEQNALFTEFRYTGNDKVYTDNPLDGTNFYNPILQGFYPDPSIARKGDDYYMVCSSFSFFPGVPIFHSKDLVNWKQLGHVLSRPSQLKLDGLQISQGIYAPAIRYNRHNDTFYLITTLVGGASGGNFIVKTKDPTSEWSEPIRLPEINGIDPSLFFDDDGRAFIVHNGDTDGKPLYDGHRTIRLWEFDTATDKIISKGKVIVNGGVNLQQKPIWIEAPHLYKKRGSYYLMCAEGGTGDWHSEVIFKSDKVEGPYIAAINNPILTQRHIKTSRDYVVTSTGHADIVTTPQGEHYAVFLGCRPYDGQKYNTGRETFILPVDWSGEYPVFEGGLEPIKSTLKLPRSVKYRAGKGGNMPNGNFTFTDNFNRKNLDARWISIRASYENFAKRTKKGLVLTPLDVAISERATPSFVGYRQQHANFMLRVKMDYAPISDKCLAGVACYQNEDFNYVLAVTLIDEVKTLVLEKRAGGKTELVAKTALPSSKSSITLAVNAIGAEYKFGYSVSGDNIIWLDSLCDGSILSTTVAKGFTGCILGLYVTSKR